MDMKSVWQDTASIPHFPRLDGDLNPDVLVIGGGLAGILCAYMLHQEGISCALVEADKIFGGVSGNTTAKITAQHGLIYDKLLRRFGQERAKLYLQANLQALESYRHFSQRIPCDLENQDSYVYSLDQPKKLEQELTALEKLGFPAQLVDKVPLPFDVAGAVRFPGQAQFHPGKFISGIAKGLNIYEHTAVRGFDGQGWQTDRGRITAKKTIVASHFPFLNKHGAYFLKLYQHRSYVLALEGGPDVDGMYVDEQKTGLSLRNHGSLLLLGGGAHRTGKSGGGWAELEAFAQKHYPEAIIRYRWATQDCMSLDGVPYIGLYSQNTPNLYVATGFNKWGMTSSMVAAAIVRDLVQERENPFAPVFSPSRSILRPQLALNTFHATVNLLTPTAPRCPHMGCALKWNRQERTWDCPCHGSRFDETGTVLNGPATQDKKLGD